MRMGKLHPPPEVFARWMKEVTALSDPFWPEWPPECQAQTDEEETP